MMRYCIGCLVIAVLLTRTDGLQNAFAIVLGEAIYDQITTLCNDSANNFIDLQSEAGIPMTTYFVLAPANIVTPFDVITSFYLYNFLLKNNTNYTAIVSRYSNFLPAIAASFNMLYYVYDYDANLLFNMMLEQVNESNYQVQNTVLTNNVRLAYAYYNLFQITDQIIINFLDDDILGHYSSYPLVFIICETPTDANLAISATSGRAVLPVIISLQAYIGNPLLTNCQGVDIQCTSVLNCAEVCQLYNLVSSIQQSVSNGNTGTIFVTLKQEAQIRYLPLIAAYGMQLGLFSKNVLWILAELWLPTNQLIKLLGQASPIYVISIPDLNVDPVQKYICTDFVSQMSTAEINGDNLPCAISKSPDADICDPDNNDNILYLGYLPTSITYTVRRLSFKSVTFFTDTFTADQQNVSYDFSKLEGDDYEIPPLQTLAQYTSAQNEIKKYGKGASQKTNRTVAWLPNNNCSSTPLKQVPVPLYGKNLTNTENLNGQAVYALGVIYEPLLMRQANFSTLQKQLIIKNLQKYGFNSSMVIFYPTDSGCDAYYDDNTLFNWCFYNASSYGIQPDLTYNSAYLNATALAMDSTFTICPLKLLVPTMDNLELYTGFSIDVLSLLRKNMNFSVEIIEKNDSLANVTQLLHNSDIFALSAIHVIVNELNSRYADFLSPSTTTGVSIIMNNQTYNSTWQVIYPFGGFVWIMIVLAIVVVSGTFKIIDHISKNEVKHYSYATLFAYTYASFTQGALDLTPRRLSARVLSMFMWFAVTLLLSSYTSAMSVVLLTPPNEGCVSGLFDLLECNVMFNAAPNSIATLMLNTPLYSNLTANYKFNGMFSDIIPLFNTNNNVTDYLHFAHIGDASFNKYYYAQYCSYLNISLIGQPQFIQFRAFAVPFNVSYRNKLDAGLLNISTSGNKSILLQKWFPDPPASCTYPTNAKSLNFTDMAGLYYILIIGCGLAICCFAWEVFKSRYNFRKQKQRAPQLQFGQVYEASVLNLMLEGVEIEIKAQPKTFMVSYENLNYGKLELKFANELGMKVGSTIFVKYFGRDKKSKAARLVLVKMEDNTETNKSILTSSA